MATAAILVAAAGPAGVVPARPAAEAILAGAPQGAAPEAAPLHGPAARAAGALTSAAPASTAPGMAQLRMRSAIRIRGLVFPSESTCAYAEALEAGGGSPAAARPNG